MLGDAMWSNRWYENADPNGHDTSRKRRDRVSGPDPDCPVQWTNVRDVSR
jgi:hypothetical protein